MHARSCDHHSVQDVTTEVRATVPRAPARTSPASGGAPSRALAPPHLLRDGYDWLLIAALAVVTVVVHPVGDMLSHPYWLDEAWVAALTKAPWDQYVRLASTAPIGFVALLRTLPDGGGQRGRMLVLAFSVLAVVATYLLVRALAWRTRGVGRFAATVAALVVMLAPVSLSRNDLKQYTCDAFVAVLLFGLGARADRLETRGALALFSVVAVLSIPFSSTALFVTMAVLAGLFASACMRRSVRRAREIVIAGVLSGAALVGYVALAVAPNVNDKLREYWQAQYLRGSLGGTLSLVWKRIDHLAPFLAMPGPVFVAFFLLGVVVLVRLRAYALAVAVPALWVEMIVLGRAERYPFLDVRTSHFMLASSLIVVALGAVGLVGAISRLWLTKHPVLGTGAAVVVGVTLAVLFGVGARPYVRYNGLPAEDVRAETRAVVDRRQPGDVILVSSTANFGFAYYWPHAHLTFHVDDETGQGFRASVAHANAIYVRSRDYPDVLAGVRAAVARLRASSEGSHLYIVRSHMNRQDALTWEHAFATVQVTPQEDVVGLEPLLVLDRKALERRRG